jgi:hypothetical protein
VLKKSLSFSLSLKALIAGVVGSFMWQSNALAADSVLIRYQDRERTITTENLEVFADTGEAVSDDIREFFAEAPQAATIANDVLTAEIFVSPVFIERFGDSALGEFVLIQLNKVLGTPSGNEDLEPLRVAIANSFENDNRFSVLEIVQNYPSDTIRLDFSGLQPIVRDVKAFVEKVEPALQVAREFLEDIVCDCEPTDDGVALEPEASETDEDEVGAGSSQSTQSVQVNPQPCQTY